MHPDTSRHALALEYLFLFHACKLTNHRADQSVSQAAVARLAGLGEEQSNEICSSLREARLIRFSSLLGDISATRFGVSEIITSKACPNSGSNYFPAISQMGLRYSRGHHLFDESELTWAARHQDSETNTVSDETEELSPAINSKPTGNETSKDIRQTLLTELEDLLEEITATPQKQPAAKRSPLRSTAFGTSRRRPVSAGKEKGKGMLNDLSGAPSLLLNANWTPNQNKSTAIGQHYPDFPGNSIDTPEPDQSSTRLQAQQKLPTPNTTQSVTPTKPNHIAGSQHLMALDTLGQLDVLYGFFQSFCRQPAGKNLIRQRAKDLIDELERVNESLFHFA